MDLPVPDHWTQVLNKIRAAFPGAVIAGGALRDLYHKRPVKDVDIFVPHFPYESSTVFDMFPEIVLDKDTIYGRDHVDKDADRDIFAIFKLVDNGVKFDIIFAANKACDMNTFDLDICQINYDGEKVSATDAFMRCVKEKFIRVMNINRTDRQAKRLERMKAKYPDYEIEKVTDV